MEKELKRYVLQQFWDEYFDYIHNDYDNYYNYLYDDCGDGNHYEINENLKLLYNITNLLKSKTDITLSTIIKPMFKIYNWNEINYKYHKSSNVHIVNYFLHGEHEEQYNLFKILKKVLNINNLIYVYTKEENEFIIKTFTDGKFICNYIQTYTFNKFLINIFKIWNLDYEHFININRSNIKLINSIDELIENHKSHIKNPFKLSLENKIYKYGKFSLQSCRLWDLCIDNFSCEIELFYEMIHELNKYFSEIQYYKPKEYNENWWNFDIFSCICNYDLHKYFNFNSVIHYKGKILT